MSLARKRAESRCRYYTRDEAKRLGWDVRHPSAGGLFLEEQEIVDYFPTLEKHLGHDRPDFAALTKDHRLRMVIECKNEVRHLDQAGSEACEYADKINRDSAFDVRLAVGVAGTPDKFVQTRGYFLKGRNAWVPLESNGYALTQLPTIDELETAFQNSDGTTDVQLPDEREFFDAAINISRILRLAKIPDSMRPKVIGAIILALYQGDFSYSRDVVLNHINSNVEAAISSGSFRDVDPRRRELLIDTLRLGAEARALRNSIEELVHQLERLNVRSIMRSGVDFLGQFYEAFLRYGSDNTKLGIVFTPRHITRYCAELTDISLGMTVYDPAAGTGGFLVAAFDRMRRNATTQAAMRKVKESLHGCDTDATVWALSVLNMFFRGDGKSNIQYKSCFKNRVAGAGFDRALLNPPFSQQGEPETDFIDHALQSLRPGGEMAVVVKTNVLVDPELRAWRKSLVANHHVLGVISLPIDLFYPKGVSTVILIVRAKSPKISEGTFLAKIRNDGFEISKKRRVPSPGSQLEPVKDLYLEFRRFGVLDTVAGLACVIDRELIEEGDEICAEQWLPSTSFGMDEFAGRREESLRQMSLAVANHPDLPDELIEGYDDLLALGPTKDRPRARACLSEWFSIRNGRSRGKKNYPGGAVPYISSGDVYNSIAGFVEPPPKDIYDTPCVTVTCFGQAYIQPWRFCARGNGGSAVRVLKPKYGMTFSELVWFAGQITEQRWRFGFGRMASPDRLNQLAVDPPPRDLPISHSIVERLRLLRSRLNDLWDVPTNEPSVAEKFRALAIRWKSERSPTSSATKMAAHPAYQEIIAMGSHAVPLIIAELEKEPDHWFIALHRLTGENPIPHEFRGKLPEMAQAWIEWGRKNVH